ncbi:MAG: 50S ribosomal protein L15 [Nitrospirae bacterium CG_4_9_14_3_um_filter_53_35]|nr:MAG: 50S ribosomal protein L15 [Nitrospirae bacterium CG2_30_53_67]PIS37635.1 MAG: 50S ribosomal protein L15 [Nitrospirae bacterium CG08_land_8_20_14_0_20_52_24]PIV82596.1 MAG: 50S ribosomal protein L15 [Nitrospirae bacterium CG17_big_fil_post_rev_8_21_14_2_50_50_9]PIW86011.1 MAG: 50S ribosomal protein L15 [Nitrospirae bacterium CG_4_8_14_3_um_filter_50_41]PIX86885.1 MAG: 50S ribosomal protein L15 [Nitrospirae bacterium CG_4_10_14_3_um_filter_53_41]PJA76364.1 MAG: 50S ribosomal protein L15 
MRLHDLKPPKGSTKKRKRIGRGNASGHGGTSTRGHKGQNARSGGSKKAGFEGGQMPLQRRLPKRGFTNIFRKEYTILNLSRLDLLEGTDQVDPEILRDKGVVKQMRAGLKILGAGELHRPMVVKAHKFSKKAAEKIRAAGGTAEIIK